MLKQWGFFRACLDVTEKRRAEKKISPLNKFSAVWIYFLGNKNGSSLNYCKKQEKISPQEGRKTPLGPNPIAKIYVKYIRPCCEFKHI